MKRNHSFRITDEFYSRLRWAAEQTRRSMSGYMVRAVDAQIGRDTTAGEISADVPEPGIDTLTSWSRWTEEETK